MLYANGKPVGGTGGHTIIDENGNSMTARAGLQFVGGANVSDDSTNNKTIVDLASAGGINGVFVDTDNVIKSTTTFTSSMSYTATEDCFIPFYIVMSGSDGVIKIDNKKVAGFIAVSTVGYSAAYYLKKGQTISVTGTHASYPSDYTVYGIQTGTTHSKFQPVIYSTEEREIGVWTDGKPLYQKTKILTSNLSYNTTNTVSLGVSDADKFVSVTGFVSYGNDKNFIPLPYGERGNSNICITGINVDSGEANIWIGPDYQASNAVNLVVINIQYTKTTDVAGSGTWTPQGVPTHHYSTDEQVIGTWVDGKTLYEKTIDFGNLPSSTIKSVDTNVSNIGLVTKVNGFAYSSGATINIPYIEASNISSKQTIDIWHNKSTNKVDINTNFDASGFYGYVTIQYTKSS